MTEFASFIMSGALVLLTAVLAWYTRTLAIEAKTTRMQQVEPQVVVTIEPSKCMTHMELVIANTGQGVARNIKVVADPDFEVENSKGGCHFNEYGFLELDVLKPRQEIRHHLGAYIHLSKHPMSMTSTCEDLFGNIHVFTTNIDVSSLEGLSRLGGDQEMKIANNVEKIALALDRALRFNRLCVDCYLEADRESERKAQAERLEQMRAEHEQK